MTNISLEAVPVLVMTCFEMGQAEGDSSFLQQCDHIVGQSKQHLAVFIMISEVIGWMTECCHSNSTEVKVSVVMKNFDLWRKSGPHCSLFWSRSTHLDRKTIWWTYKGTNFLFTTALSLLRLRNTNQLDLIQLNLVIFDKVFHPRLGTVCPSPFVFKKCREPL